MHRAAKDLLQKGKDLLEAIQQHKGKTLPGYIGSGALYEAARDAEWIVIEQDTGSAYYTDNHYRTFMPLN